MTTYSFRLYVAGQGPRSQAAESNLRLLCEAHLVGDYALEVVDVDQCPDLAAEEQIIATPTVVRLTPAPRLRVIGDLSELGRAASFLLLPDSSRPPLDR